KLKVKTYILQKPMFLTELESIQDVFSTIDAIKKTTDSISINPVAVHSRTPLEQLWKRKEYRPPWLSSVVETFNYAVKKFDCTNLGLVGAGTPRGPHNCRSCDKKIIAALWEGFEKQEKINLDELEKCQCTDYYKELLECEHLFFDASPRTIFD
ncbi:MAG: TIGR01210 family radical SAM protein, partial [Candidatus Diapherotrites archaeon]|nr:TIGR01210 family radical SAM protein [Candidatus Diapherotrites archaeon]